MARTKKAAKNVRKKFFKRRKGRESRKNNVVTQTVAVGPSSRQTRTTSSLEQRIREEQGRTTRALNVVATCLEDFKDVEADLGENMELAAELLEEQQQQQQQLQQQQQRVTSLVEERDYVTYRFHQEQHQQHQQHQQLQQQQQKCAQLADERLQLRVDLREEQ